MIVHIVIDNKDETVFHFLTVIRMSVGTSDSTVISPITTEAHNLNTTNASAAPRDDGSPATTLANSKKIARKYFLLL